MGEGSRGKDDVLRLGFTPWGWRSKRKSEIYSVGGESVCHMERRHAGIVGIPARSTRRSGKRKGRRSRWKELGKQEWPGKVLGRWQEGQPVAGHTEKSGEGGTDPWGLFPTCYSVLLSPKGPASSCSRLR